MRRTLARLLTLASLVSLPCVALADAWQRASGDMAQPSAVPGAPQGLSGTASGGVLALQWLPPLDSEVVLGYLVRAGSAPGIHDLFEGPVGNVLSVSAPVPLGQYHLSVAALNTSGVGTFSAEIVVAVGGQLPGTPRSFAAAAAGSDVTLTWQAPATGGAVSTYVVRAGTSPGTANLFYGPVGSATSVSATLPPGTYFFGLAARNGVGTSAETSETNVVVAGCAPPGAPTALRQTFSGAGSVSLQWSAPPTGVDLYVIEAGSRPGVTDIFRGNHSSDTSVVIPNVPPGTYFIRVRGRTACGEGSPSNELMLTVAAPMPNVSGTWTLFRSGSTAFPWIQTYSTFTVTLVQNGAQLTGSIRPTIGGAPATPIVLGTVTPAGDVLFGSESAYWNDYPGTLGSDGYFRLTLDTTGLRMQGGCTDGTTCSTAFAVKN